MQNKSRRIACLVMVALLLPCLTLPVTAQTSGVPSLSAGAAVLIEAESGAVILEQNASARLPMASTTKIMTALVALELSSPDTRITVDAAAVGAEGSSVYLCAGEALTLEQLLYALLLESANDAALAIAIGLCGNVEDFSLRMNEKAASLGLTDTHFVNPHGLDDDAHYTTALELARLTQAALQNETFARIVSTRRATIPHGENAEGRLLINHNTQRSLSCQCRLARRCDLDCGNPERVQRLAGARRSAGLWLFPLPFGSACRCRFLSRHPARCRRRPRCSDTDKRARALGHTPRRMRQYPHRNRGASLSLRPHHDG